MKHRRPGIPSALFLVLSLVILAVLASGGVTWAAPQSQGTVTPPPPPPPPPEPSPYCCLPGVVFTSTRDGNEEVYVMKADGSEIVRLTNNPASDIHPAATMDGMRIAFASNRDDPDPQTCGKPGKPNCVYHIYVMNVDGSGVTRVTNGPGMDLNPIWSMTGARLAFVSTTDDPKLQTCGQSGQPACVTHVYLVDSAGSSPTRLTSNPASSPTAANNEPSWSPDDFHIAFVSNRDGNSEVYSIGTDGSGLTRLTNNPAADGHPSWSPDGNYLAFESNRDGRYQLYVMNADGSGSVRITNTDSLGVIPIANALAEDRFPTWMPGCVERIVFSSNRDGGVYRVFVVDPDGTNPVRLTTLPTGQSASDVFPSWSGLPPQVSLPGACCVPGVAFQSMRDGNEEIYLMQWDGSRLTRLTVNPARDLQPAPSPDGTRVVFVSNRDGRLQLYVMNVDGSGTYRLTNSVGDDTAPVWSNDSSRLAFVSTRDDPDPATCGQPGKPACVKHVYIMNARGGAATRVTTNPPTSPNAANDNPYWSPDDRRLVFQSNRDGNDEVYIANTDGSGVARLTNNPASDGHPGISPNGRLVAFESDRDGRFQLYVMNLDGSNPTRVTNNPGQDRHPYWCPSCLERIVYASSRDGVTFSIYAVSADGTNPVRLTTQQSGSTAPDDEPAWSGVPFQLPARRVLSPLAPTPVPTKTATGGGGIDAWFGGLLDGLGRLFGGP